MKLSELSAQYRESGQACRKRAYELSRRLRDADLSEMEKLLLRRRITILTTMANDTLALASYMSNYYNPRRRP